MAKNLYSQGLQRLLKWWPSAQPALRARRWTRGNQDSIPALVELLEPRKLLTPTPASFTAFQAGNTLIITSPQPNYNVSDLDFIFFTAGLGNPSTTLTLNCSNGTKVNGNPGVQFFAGVNSVTAFLGNGDDHLTLHAGVPNGAQIGSLSLFLSGGINSVNTNNVQVVGSTLIESSAGQVDLNAANTTFSQGLTLIGGQSTDSVEFNSSSAFGTATFLMGGGTSTLFFDHSTLGSTLIIGSGSVDLTAQALTQFTSLTVLGGTAADHIEIQSSTTVVGGTTLLLGGGANHVDVSGSSFQGHTFIEAGAGSLVMTTDTSSFTNGLLLIGGTAQPDSISFVNSSFSGGETFLLGANSGDQFGADYSSFGGQFTLFASAATDVFVETSVPNAQPGTVFLGPASFFVGANSLLYFGHDPLPSDPTKFNSGLRH